MTRIKLPLSLGYSVLAGPIIWFVHFIIVYVAGEFGCRINFTNQLIVSLTTIQLIVGIVTIVSVIGVGIGGMMAYRQWQSAENQQNDVPSPEMLVHFLAMMAMLLSALFLFAIVMTAVPTIFLSTCDWVT
jgi:hypothetical protein